MRLAQNPTETIAFLASRFQPVESIDGPAVAELIRNLDSNQFVKREEAARKLEELGIKVGQALRKVQAEKPPPEMRRRIDAILGRIAHTKLRLPTTGDSLRGVRAIEVLERIASRDAKQLLQAWARQDAHLLLASEAGVALERIAPSRKSDDAEK